MQITNQELYENFMTEEYNLLADQIASNMKISRLEKDIPVIVGFNTYVYCMRIQDNIILFSPQKKTASQRHKRNILKEAKNHGLNTTETTVDRLPKFPANTIEDILTEEVIEQLPDNIKEEITAEIL